MAGDTLDGCMPSKMVQEDMEVGQAGGEVGEFNASQEINSQPATQPLDSSFDMETQSQREEEDGLWDLSQDSFKLGCVKRSVEKKILIRRKRIRGRNFLCKLNP